MLTLADSRSFGTRPDGLGLLASIITRSNSFGCSLLYFLLIVRFEEKSRISLNKRLIAIALGRLSIGHFRLFKGIFYAIRVPSRE